MIEVKNLVKRYGDHTAVDHLSFEIEKGKIYGFLGPNGAGKSTTMNMITGYIASTEGTVVIDGHDILEEPEEAKKCIGYLPEMPPLYFDMTVLEYLKFVADLKKIPKDKKATMIEEIMDMVKITDMKNRLIKNLSKGYRQRVGIAQAVLGDKCISTTILQHGAAAIFYPGVCRKICEVLGAESLYLVFTSVHEVMVSAVRADVSVEEMQRRLHNGSRTVKEPEEKLTEQVYCYDGKSNCIRLAKGEGKVFQCDE